MPHPLAHLKPTLYRVHPSSSGSWSLAGLVKDSDVEAITVLNEVDAKIELDKLGDILSRTCHRKI